MRCARIFLVAFFSLFFVSCQEITFEGGRIPDQYLAEVARYAGDYRGEFLGQAGTLHFLLEGNHARLDFTGDDGYDILHGCEAYLGELQKARFAGNCHGETRGLESVTFAIYPGHCADYVVGREFIVDLVSSGESYRWDARVLKENGSAGPVYFQGVFFGPQ